MLSKFARVLLACTATAPILFTYSFMIWLDKKDVMENVHITTSIMIWLRKKGIIEIICPSIIALFLVLSCIFILRFAKKNIQTTPIQIVEITPEDKEVLNFIIAYLLPLVTTKIDDINYPLFTFVFIFMTIIILITNAYSINPLLSIVGYHFYQVKTQGQISHLLITKKVLINVSQVTHVVKLTEYIALEV